MILDGQTFVFPIPKIAFGMDFFLQTISEMSIMPAREKIPRGKPDLISMMQP